MFSLLASWLVRMAFKRPGGSALNAGQAGGLRAADYINNTASAGEVADIDSDQAKGCD